MRTERHSTGNLVLGALRRALANLRVDRFTLLCFLLLAPVELLGQWGTSDGTDLALVTVLAAWCLLVYVRHRRTPLPWVTSASAFVRSIRKRVEARMARAGIDLRSARSPSNVPRGIPPVLLAVLSFVVLGSTTTALLAGFDGLLLRDLLRPVSGLLWIATLGGLWCAMATGTVFALLLTVVLVRESRARAHLGPGPRSRAVERLIAWTVPPACVVAGLALPPASSLPVLAAILALVAPVSLLPGADDRNLLWLPRGGGPMRSLGFHEHNLAFTAIVGLGTCLCVLLVGGSPLATPDRMASLASVFIVSSPVAGALGWAGAAMLFAWSGVYLPLLFEARRVRTAGAPGPGTVRILPAAGGERPAAATAALREAGFRVVFGPESPRCPAVPIVLDESAPPRDPWATHRGPPFYRSSDLTDPAVRRSLSRRVELRLRRLLVRGLARVFKQAAARRFERGNGFWVAPHLWLSLGLSRDEDETRASSDESPAVIATIGPSWLRLFAPEIRDHLRQMMDALDLDLVFVEDGVRFHRFRNVLRMAFEVFDMHGGTRRAEEQHFLGLPGVRVIIHEFELKKQDSWKQKDYPEPDYETLGRGRVLHVFRDREESKDTVDAPMDRRDAPVLVR